jgi:CheY-like chemotaxis protein
LTFVNDGEQALSEVLSKDFDLIFMDIQMPNKDGLAATRAIRKWEGENGRTPVPIIALTASALDEDVQQSLLAGCNAHISKPVKKRVIVEAIRNAAEHRPSPSAIAQ